MNDWVKRSIGIAGSKGYLDSLSRIYPAELPHRRPLNSEQRERIQQLHKKQNWRELLRFLLALIDEGHPFPFEHPYASIFYQHPQLIEKNPQVVRLLGKILLSKNTDEIIRGVERPPDLNRLYGVAFRKWLRETLPSRGYKLLKLEKIKDCEEPALLEGADKIVRRYVKTILKFDPGGRDFLIKIGETHIVGEARFLTRGGGSQNRDIREALTFVRKFKKRPKFTSIAILDGVAWFDNTYLKQLKALKKDEPALTALLLGDFLESLRK